MNAVSARPLALIVEDSEDQVALLRRHLSQEQYDVIAMPNAESALAAFDDIEPQLAVVDLLLPGISGAELVEQLRARFPACRVVVSSVLDLAEYPDADAALPKPVRGAQLHEVVARLRE